MGQDQLPDSSTKRKTVTIAAAPNEIGKGRVDLKQDDFDVIVYQKGYDVIWETAVRCPCYVKGHGESLPTCKNCGGVGYFYINPKETRMVIQSMNTRNEKKEWGMELVGTAAITPRVSDHLAYMDRLTVKGSRAIFTEVLEMKLNNGYYYAFLMYPNHQMFSAFRFKDVNTKHELILDHSITNGNLMKVPVTGRPSNDGKIMVAVRYEHLVQYLVDDTQRDIRDTQEEELRVEQRKVLPVSAVAKRAHIMQDPIEFNGSSLIDNSYATS